MKTIAIFAALLLCGGRLAAQAEGAKEFGASFSLKDSTVDRKIFFNVGEDIKTVRISVEGHLTDGSASTALEAPDGKKEGHFQLVAQTPDSAGKKNAYAEYTSNVKLPVPGKWVIELHSQHATGSVRYTVTFSNEAKPNHN